MSKAKKLAYAEKQKAAATARSTAALGDVPPPEAPGKDKPKKQSRGK